jgi:predicted nucleotidyltransferase
LIAIKQDLEGLRVNVVTENSISPYMRDAVLKEAIAL